MQDQENSLNRTFFHLTLLTVFRQINCKMSNLYSNIKEKIAPTDTKTAMRKNQRELTRANRELERDRTVRSKLFTKMNIFIDNNHWSSSVFSD